MTMRYVPIDDVVLEIVSGVSPVCEEREAGPHEIGVLKLSAITGGTLDLTAAKAIASDLVQPSWPRVSAGAILISRASGSKDLVGACVAVTKSCDQRVVPDTAWQLTIDETAGALAHWIVEYLRSASGRRAINQIARGTNGIWKITKGEFRRVQVPLPEPERMHAVTCALEAHDRQVAATNALLTAKRVFRRALLQELLTGRRRFGGFDTTAIPSVALGEVALSGAARNRGTLGKARVMGVLKDAGMAPMRDHVRAADLSRYQIVPPDGFAYNPMRLNIGSIARNRSGADCLVSPDYVVFTTDPSVLLPAYLDQVRRSDIWSDFVRPAGAGSVRVRIYFRDLAEIQIPLPSLDEQRRIVHVLEAADREIASLEKLRDAYDAQKRAVMQRLLSGDLLLPAPTAAPELAHA